jgi:hypothetical protein
MGSAGEADGVDTLRVEAEALIAGLFPKGLARQGVSRQKASQGKKKKTCFFHIIPPQLRKKNFPLPRSVYLFHSAALKSTDELKGQTRIDKSILGGYSVKIIRRSF